MPDKLLRLRQTFWFFSCWFGATILGAFLMQITASSLGIGNWQHLISKIKELQPTHEQKPTPKKDKGS